MFERLRSGDRAYVRRRVMSMVAPYRWRVAVLTVVSFLGGLCEAAFLVLVTRTGLAVASGDQAFDIGGGWSLSVGTAMALAAALLIARLGLALAGVHIGARVAADATSSARRRLAGAFLNASWAVQQAEPSGRLQMLVTGFASYVGSVVGAFASSLTAALNLAAILLASLLVDPLATVLVVLSLGMLGGLLRPIRRRIRLRSKASARVSMTFANSVSELGELGMEMQVFGVRRRFAARIGELVDQVEVTTRRAQTMQGSLSPIYTSLAYAALVGGLVVVTLAGAGEISALGAVMVLMLRSLSYGQQLQVTSASMLSALPWVDDADVMRERYELAGATGGTVEVAHLGAIAAEHVSFDYNSGEAVLRDVDFTIAPGEVVGVIGPSGAGKSTLVQLLLGLRDPVEGTITIGGTDLREVERSSWSSRVALVPQDAHLFTGTVADNIRFFRDGLSDGDLRVAAERANVAEEIEALPDGYDTHLGERGQRLSGGQRQRLSIARALAGRPQLLVLDEPTSALDVRSEALIRDTIAELHGEVTVVIIAHRMSTLDVCDRIMVIESGEMTAFDTPAALRSQSDFYVNALELSGIAAP